MKRYCFGIDVGGTTIKCGLFQTDGKLLEKWEVKTRTENSGEKILPDIADTVEKKITGKRDLQRGSNRYRCRSTGTGEFAGRCDTSCQSFLGI